MYLHRKNVFKFYYFAPNRNIISKLRPKFFILFRNAPERLFMNVSDNTSKML